MQGILFNAENIIGEILAFHSLLTTNDQYVFGMGMVGRLHKAFRV